jgi:hypothetical protein
MRLMKAFPISILATAWLCSTVLMAQSSSVAPRIISDVNEQSLKALQGNVPLLARAEFDQGEASPSTQMNHMRLVLSRSSEQQAALDSYLAQLQDKSSPNYHKWLTPEQFGQLYGPADSDIATLVTWLESHGLQVETVSKGRTNIAFNGTVSQVEEAFHTSIHTFQTSEQQFYSNTTDPLIPSALAPVVKGVAHLNTIRPRPQSHRVSRSIFNPHSKLLNSDDSTPANRPRAGLTESACENFLYMTPSDAATIYDTPNSFNANFTSGTSYTGSGVNIGIGGDATITASIVGTYRSTFLGSSTTPTLNYCTSSSSCSSTPGSGYVADDADEAYLDTELSGGMAPGATIYYYASTDLVTGIEAAIDANVVDIFSLSFGECEQNLSTSDNAQINGWYEQAAAQGIAVTVSSGDSGSAACDGDTAKATTVAKYGLSVSGFASTPYNIAVGGTDFYGLESSFTSYSSASLGTAGAPTYYRTVLATGPHNGYIPESIWNDSIVDDTQQINDDESWTSKSGNCGSVLCSSLANIVAGSGGASSCSTNNSVDNANNTVTPGSCISGYSKPAWQTGAGVPADGVRDIPDVSMMSGNGYDGATWLVCDGDTYYLANDSCSSTTKGVLNCSNISGGYFDGFGGTSTAAPAFAGVLALVQQNTGSRLGQAAQVLYSIYNSGTTTASKVFHDVTVGNNSVPCTSGSPNCVANLLGYDFETGYNALTGFDLASGMGSVDAAQLVNYWSTASSTSTATVALSLTPSTGSITTMQSLTVKVSVTGTSTTPTGNVTLSGGGYLSSVEALSTSGSAGVYTFTIPAGSLAAGSDTLTAIYNADASNSTYGIATGTASVTVTGLTATVTVTPASGSIDSNQSYNVTVTVSGSSTQESSPTGNVTLTSGSYNSGAQALGTTGCTSGSCVTITIPANSLSSGSDTLTAAYSGDADYVSGTGTTTVTVTTSVFALAATTPASIAPGASTTSIITVSSSTQYSGTVTLTCALTSSPSGAAYLPSCSSGSNTVTLSSSAASVTSTIMVSTTAATSDLAYPKLPGRGQGNGRGLFGAGGGALLAFLLFLGIPARRRSWRSMLGILIVMAALGSLAACGGGGGGGGGGTSGTTAGTYTFTVTGTGSDTNKTTETTTFTVTVT